MAGSSRHFTSSRLGSLRCQPQGCSHSDGTTHTHFYTSTADLAAQMPHSPNAPQGAVTVLALSVPLVPSLLMLLRLMSARSYATVTLQSAYMLVEEQADLMATGNNPNVPYAELSVRPCLL